MMGKKPSKAKRRKTINNTVGPLAASAQKHLGRRCDIIDAASVIPVGKMLSTKDARAAAKRAEHVINRPERRHWHSYVIIYVAETGEFNLYRDDHDAYRCHQRPKR